MIYFFILFKIRRNSELRGKEMRPRVRTSAFDFLGQYLPNWSWPLLPNHSTQMHSFPGISSVVGALSVTHIRNLRAVLHYAVGRANTCLGVPYSHFKKIMRKKIWVIYDFLKKSVLDLYVLEFCILCILNYTGEYQWGSNWEVISEISALILLCQVIFNFLSFLHLTTTKFCYCRRIRSNSSYCGSP